LTLSPAFLGIGRDSPVIIDSFTSLEPSRTTPSTGILAPGAYENEIAVAQLVERDLLGAISDDANRRVRQEFRERPERALGL